MKFLERFNDVFDGKLNCFLLLTVMAVTVCCLIFVSHKESPFFFLFRYLSLTWNLLVCTLFVVWSMKGRWMLKWSYKARARGCCFCVRVNAPPCLHLLIIFPAQTTRGVLHILYACVDDSTWRKGGIISDTKSIQGSRSRERKGKYIFNRSYGLNTGSAEHRDQQETRARYVCNKSVEFYEKKRVR